jgi:hypothetical protein
VHIRFDSQRHSLCPRLHSPRQRLARSVEADGSDTVEDVKQMIHEKDDIQPAHQVNQATAADQLRVREREIDASTSAQLIAFLLSFPRRSLTAVVARRAHCSATHFRRPTARIVQDYEGNDTARRAAPERKWYDPSSYIDRGLCGGLESLAS